MASNQLELERLVVRLETDATGLTKGLNRALTDVKYFAGQIQGEVNKVSAVGIGKGAGGGAGGTGGPGGGGPGGVDPGIFRAMQAQAAARKKALATSGDKETQQRIDQATRGAKEANQAQDKAARQAQLGNMGKGPIPLPAYSAKASEQAALAKDSAKAAADASRPVQRALLEGRKKDAAKAQQEELDVKNRKLKDDIEKAGKLKDKAEQNHLNKEVKRLTAEDEKKQRSLQREVNANYKADQRTERQKQASLQRQVNAMYRADQKADSAKQASAQRQVNAMFKEDEKARKAKIKADADAAQESAEQAAKRRDRVFNKMGAVVGAVVKGAAAAGKMAMEGIVSGAKGAVDVAGAIAAPIQAGMKKSVDAFSDYDLAMTESTSIMGNLSKDTQKQMHDVVQSLAMTTRFTPAQLAGAFYEMASAGLNAEAAIAALPQVTKFAQAGAMDLAKATQILASSTSAMGYASENAGENLKQMTRISDVLVKANTVSIGSTQDFGEALVRDAAQMSRIYGIAVEDSVALIAAYQKQATIGKAAGGLAARGMRLMITAAVGKGSKAMKDSGINVFDPLTGKFRGMANIVDDLTAALGHLSDEGMGQALLAFGMPEKSQRAILPLIKFGGVIKDIRKQLKQATEEKFTEVVSDKQIKAFAHQMQIMKNAILLVAIEFGELLAPAILFVNELVREAASWWQGLDKSTRGVILTIIAAIGVFFGMVGGITAVSAAVGLFMTLLNPVTALIMAVLTALSLLGAGGVIELGGIGKTVEFLKKKFAEFKEWAKPIFIQFQSVFAALKELIQTTWARIVSFIKKQWGDLTGAINTDDLRSQVVDFLILVEWALKNIDKAWAIAWTAAKYYATSFINWAIANFVPEWLKMFKKTFVMQVGMIVSFLGWMKDAFVENFRSILDAAADFGVTMVLAMKGNVNAIGQFFERQKANKIQLPWEFDFDTGAFKSPKLAALEKDLKEQLEKLKDASKEDFEKFLQERRDDIEKLWDERFDIKGLEEANKKLEKEGREGGARYTKGITEGMRFDAVLVKSAEAVTRMEEYRNKILDRGRPGEGPLRMDVVQGRDAEAKTREQDQLSKLERIAQAVEKQLQKKELQLEDADL